MSEMESLVDDINKLKTEIAKSDALLKESNSPLKLLPYMAFGASGLLVYGIKSMISKQKIVAMRKELAQELAVKQNLLIEEYQKNQVQLQKQVDQTGRKNEELQQQNQQIKEQLRRIEIVLKEME